MPTGDIKRIVILTLDSFYSNGAVSKLIDHYGDRISLIVLVTVKEILKKVIPSLSSALFSRQEITAQ